jgi:hypothetical protein
LLNLKEIRRRISSFRNLKEVEEDDSSQARRGLSLFSAISKY